MRLTHPTNQPNFAVLHAGGLIVYFSYETPIAYMEGRVLVISENVWSKTTGKHLNWISTDKSWRVPHDKFVESFKAIGERMPNLLFQ